MATFYRGGFRTAVTSKMQHFVRIVNRLEAVNYCQKVLNLRCSRSASAAHLDKT